MQTNKCLIDFDDYYRKVARRKYAPIDATRTSEDIRDESLQREMREKAGIILDRNGEPVDVWKNPPMIDRLMPWILVWGGLALLIGLYGLLDWFLFTIVPGVM